LSTHALHVRPHVISMFFFFFHNATSTSEIYTLSLHDALPIFEPRLVPTKAPPVPVPRKARTLEVGPDMFSVPVLGLKPLNMSGPDRKSTRLNSSHDQISYAVFCLKKKKDKFSTHQKYPKTITS